MKCEEENSDEMSSINSKEWGIMGMDINLINSHYDTGWYLLSLPLKETNSI